MVGALNSSDDSCSLQSTDFQTAYENQSNDQKREFNNSSRRGSFDATSGDVEIETTSSQEGDVSCACSDKVQKETKKSLKFNPQAMPYFKPTTTFVPQEAKSEEQQKDKSLKNEIENMTLNNDFTPSTPYVHKFRTEMCKNWEQYGYCKYGDEVSDI